MPGPEPPLKIVPSSTYQLRIESIVSSTARMKQLCTRRFAAEVLAALGLDVVDLHLAEVLDPLDLQSLHRSQRTSPEARATRRASRPSPGRRSRSRPRRDADLRAVRMRQRPHPVPVRAAIGLEAAPGEKIPNRSKSCCTPRTRCSEIMSRPTTARVVTDARRIPRPGRGFADRRRPPAAAPRRAAPARPCRSPRVDEVPSLDERRGASRRRAGCGGIELVGLRLERALMAVRRPGTPCRAQSSTHVVLRVGDRHRLDRQRPVRSWSYCPTKPSDCSQPASAASAMSSVRRISPAPHDSVAMPLAAGRPAAACPPRRNEPVPSPLDAPHEVVWRDVERDSPPWCGCAALACDRWP